MRAITQFTSRGITYPLSYVQRQQDNFGLLVPQARKVIGKDGGFDELGILPALAEVGNLQADIILSVIGSDLSAMTAQLNHLLKLSRESKCQLYATMEDGTIRWCLARVDDISAPQSEDKHTEIILRSSVVFQISDPHWYQQGTEAPAWGHFEWGFASWGGTALPVAVAGTQTDYINTVDDGNVATQPRIRITCGTGQTAQNIQIQRLEDGIVVDEVLYTGTLVDGDLLEINPRKLQVLLNGSDAFDNLTWLNRAWFTLMPGDNDIRVIMTNGGDEANVTMNYFYKFV